MLRIGWWDGAGRVSCVVVVRGGICKDDDCARGSGNCEGVVGERVGSQQRGQWCEKGEN